MNNGWWFNWCVFRLFESVNILPQSPQYNIRWWVFLLIFMSHFPANYLPHSWHWKPAFLSWIFLTWEAVALCDDQEDNYFQLLLRKFIRFIFISLWLFGLLFCLLKFDITFVWSLLDNYLPWCVGSLRSPIPDNYFEVVSLELVLAEIWVSLSGSAPKLAPGWWYRISLKCKFWR